MTNISNELRELLEVNAPELLAERENEDAEAMRQAWFRVIDGHLQRQAKCESTPNHPEQQLDMVERVARAIAATHVPRGGHFVDNAWPDFVEEAQAAIAAMDSEQVQLGSELNLSEELSEEETIQLIEAAIGEVGYEIYDMAGTKVKAAYRALKQIADIRRKP